MSKLISIVVKSGPGFEHVLPEGDGATALTLPAGSVLDDVVDMLNMDSDARFLTAINDEIVLKSQRATTVVHADDVIDILPPLTGG